MAIRHGCFFSYAHGQHSLMNKFRDDFADALRCYLEPHFDNEQELFIDREQLGGGDDIERRLARALCESVCMVVIYTPKYEAHVNTRREFAAMQRIEEERAKWYRLPSRLIIPVIMTRHPFDLPDQIKLPGLYLDFTRYTLATGELKSNPDYLPQIVTLAERIATQYHLLKMHIPAQHDCNQFVLPDVTGRWRDLPDFVFPPI
jgi:hypothetical protein